MRLLLLQHGVQLLVGCDLLSKFGAELVGELVLYGTQINVFLHGLRHLGHLVALGGGECHGFHLEEVLGRVELALSLVGIIVSLDVLPV